MIATSCAVGAAEVYESETKDGVIEFSDQNSPDARQIEVKPNVVDVTPVKPLEAAPDNARDAMPEAPMDAGDAGEDLEVVHRGVVDEDDERVRRAREQVREQAGDAVRAGADKGAEAAHRGAHRRR